jgi:2-succinyl-6-hydroxy-2,4-cyclohexadiene-1-carboxylate synthase
VHLAGYSLGARLGLGLLLRHPELFASATLASVHPGLGHPTERAARRLADCAWCELLEARGITAFVDAWQAQPLFSYEARLSRAERDMQREIRLSHSASGLCRSLRATGLGQMPSYAARLGELELPVTLLCGDLDSKFRELATQLVSSLSDGTLEVVPDAGHNLLMERPDIVAGAIARGART